MEGFSHKLPLLTQRLFQAMAAAVNGFDGSAFAREKEALVRKYKNTNMQVGWVGDRAAGGEMRGCGVAGYIRVRDSGSLPAYAVEESRFWLLSPAPGPPCLSHVLVSQVPKHASYCRLLALCSGVPHVDAVLEQLQALQPSDVSDLVAKVSAEAIGPCLWCGFVTYRVLLRQTLFMLQLPCELVS